MKRFVAAVLLCLPIAGYVTYASIRPLPDAKPSLVLRGINRGSQSSIVWPSSGQSATGAVGYGLLGASQKEMPLPTASTIKVLTALAVLKQKPLGENESGPIITLDSSDVAYYNQQMASNGSVVRVKAGATLTQYQALQALLLPSANNMAYSLAEWAYGSIDAYLAAANELATNLGMVNTKVTDPSGLSGSTVSTASDLVRLGIAAMNEPAIAKIVSQKTAYIPVEGQISNTNDTLGEDNIIGMKTGTTDEAGSCFIGARQIEVGGKTIVVITAMLAAPTRGIAMGATVPLSTSVAGNFIETPVIKKGTEVAMYTVPWEPSPIRAVTASDTSFVRWTNDESSTKVSVMSVDIDATGSETVGTIVTKTNQGEEYSSDVVLVGDIPAPSWWWRLTHPL